MALAFCNSQVVRSSELDSRGQTCYTTLMKDKTMNPWLQYSLEDLFYELEAAEDEGKEKQAEAIRQAIDTLVAA